MLKKLRWTASLVILAVTLVMYLTRSKKVTVTVDTVDDEPVGI